MQGVLTASPGPKAVLSDDEVRTGGDSRLQYPSCYNEPTMLFVPFISVAGILVSIYIWHKKRTTVPFLCPLNSDCTKVLTSRWSSTFGIPNELLGIAGFLGFGVGAALVLRGVAFVWFVPVLLALKLAAVGALGFTLFLLYLQLRVIREWCFWCLVTAACTISIDLIILI